MVRQSQESENEMMLRNLAVLQKKVNDIAKRRSTTDGNKFRKIREFKQPEHEENISDISKKCFTPQSKRKMMWGVNLYKYWHSNRMVKSVVASKILNSNLDLLGTFTEHDLCYSLSRFVREVKKIDGTDYPQDH